MNWFEIAKYRYVRNYMTLAQVERCLSLGLITEEQFQEIIKLK